jgi:5'-nucleotidase
MRILVTNDDGAGAHGLSVLHQIARALSDDVWIVAPETNQSGASHALTLQVPLRYREIGERAYAVRGTPADCVIMGVKHVLKDRAPDLVLSGVNHGANLAEDVSYSGTIAGAMEGTLLGIRSIAMSLTIGFDPEGRQHWKTPLEHGPRLVAQLLSMDWPKSTLMNVNYPDLAPGDVAGVQATAQGRRDQGGLQVIERKDTWGASYFWVGGGPYPRTEPPAGTDLSAIANGFISITPLHLDLTHRAVRDELAHLFSSDAERPLKDAG